MPYRRLPNTDAARKRAMEIAYVVGQEQSPKSLAYSQILLHKLQVIIPQFNNAVVISGNSLKLKKSSSKTYNELKHKAKLYVQHFIKSIFMAIEREEMKESDKSFYQLPLNSKRVPKLDNDSQIIKWGKTIVAGEAERCKLGGNALFSPKITLVRMYVEKFEEIVFKYTKALESYKRDNNLLKELRVLADELIKKLWDEVGFTYRLLNDEEKFNKLVFYGIKFYFRKSEKSKNIEVYPELQKYIA